MIDIFNLPIFLVLNFFLVFTRISSILFFGPVFNSRIIPNLVKIGLGVLITIIIYPFVKKINFDINKLNILTYLTLIILEVTVGIIIGLMATFIFSAIQTAGQLIGFSMGLAIANVFDPITNEQVSEISHLQNIFALWIFLLLNGHHIFIKACVHSFEFIPLAGFYLKTNFISMLIKAGGEIFVIAVKIGAPMIFALFVVDLAFAIISRLAPQVNIMIVGIPVKIFVGFLFMMISMPLFVYMFKTLFSSFMKDVFLLIKSFGG
jgi:flagellar biosynthetic protein FliR